MSDRPILVRDGDGNATIIQGGEELGAIRFIRSGKNKSKYQWQSLLALTPCRDGIADSESEALAQIGFKVIHKHSGAICYDKEEA